MRGKNVDDLVRIMKNKDEKKLIGDRWDKYRVDDFGNIKSLVAPCDGKQSEYYLGVREDYMNLYYRGMSLGKVHAYYSRGCNYGASYYYANGLKDGDEIYSLPKDSYKEIPSKVFWNPNNIMVIRKHIDDHVLGFHNGLHLEKICQQWIMNANNVNPDSPWYYVDMEYIYKSEEGEEKKHPFGRADLIAISKHPNDKGIHDVAFIELKVGTKSYSVKCDTPELLPALKKNMYDDKVNGIKLGSGLASHIVDFMHFFYEDFYQKQVRNEILKQIQTQREFGMVPCDSELMNINSVDKIAMIPSIQIVTYSEVPGIGRNDVSESSLDNYPNVDLKSMKTSFYNYFYMIDKSVKKLMNEDQIRGICDLEEDFKKFLDNDDEYEISCKQKINEEPFLFVFRFIDIKKKQCPFWQCIR